MAFRYGPGPLLDSFPGAQAAYSLRKVNSSYTGSCLTVRRSSDNATTNIGFYRYTVDTDAILRFVGTGSGFVTTWFDQSGRGANIINSTAATQFLIATSGSLHYEGTDLVMNAPTNKTFFSSGTSLTDWTVYIKAKATSDAAYIGGNSNLIQLAARGTFSFRQASDSLYKDIGSYSTTYRKIQAKRTSSTNTIQGYQNGILTGTNTTAESLLLNNQIFGTFAGTGYQGTIREMIIYPVTHDNLTIQQINNMM